jgi:hypothetical protein
MVEVAISSKLLKRTGAIKAILLLVAPVKYLAVMIVKKI